MTVAPSSLHISSDFDSGNIQVLDASDPFDVKLAIKSDTKSPHFQWFHFKVDGLTPGQTHHFHLTNASQSSYNKAWDGYRAVASYDQEHWFRVPTDFDGTALNFSLEPHQSTVWFAYFEPYSRARHETLISEAKQWAGCEVLAVGKSAEGRDIPLLRKRNGPPHKRAIWIIAQQHPGEHMAEWFMEGIFKRLEQGSDPQLLKLLNNADLYLIPNMNPDGAFHGHLRTNANGQDLNRAWQNTSPQLSPEVFFALEQMNTYGVSLFLDIHGDEEIPYVFTAGCEGNPGYTPRLAALEARFRDDLKARTQDFQTTHGYTRDEPGQANMTLACNSVGEHFDCLSLTLEMPFKDNNDAPNPRTGWDGQRSMQLGKDVLSTLSAMVKELR